MTRSSVVRAVWNGVALASLAGSVAVIGLSMRPAAPASGAGHVLSLRRLMPVPSEPISLKGAAMLGDHATAPVALVFSDFQCPFCGTFARTTLKDVEARYVATGRVQLAFRHYPLETIHPYAMRAAKAAECAKRDRRFWEMHDWLFAHQSQLGDADLTASARAVGVDPGPFTTCLAADAETAVRADLAEGRLLNLRSTPTVIFGQRLPNDMLKVTKIVSGQLTAVQFAEEIDAIAAASSSR